MLFLYIIISLYHSFPFLEWWLPSIYTLYMNEWKNEWKTTIHQFEEVVYDGQPNACFIIKLKFLMGGRRLFDFASIYTWLMLFNQSPMIYSYRLITKWHVCMTTEQCNQMRAWKLSYVLTNDGVAISGFSINQAFTCFNHWSTEKSQPLFHVILAPVPTKSKLIQHKCML